jgi:hypothetical protein
MSDEGAWSKSPIPDEYAITQRLKAGVIQAMEVNGKGSIGEVRDQIFHLVTAVYALEKLIVDDR